MTARPNLSLVLASSSPRRRDLLSQIGVMPDAIRSPDINESPRKGELPRPYAERMASEKARAVPREEGEVVLALRVCGLPFAELLLLECSPCVHLGRRLRAGLIELKRSIRPYRAFIAYAHTQ